MVCDGDNGTYVYWRNTFSIQANETIELFFNYIDNGVGSYGFYIGGATLYIFVTINSADNKIYAYYGNGAGGNNTSNVAVTPDTTIHLKVTWNSTTDTYSCWVNGTNLIDDENLYNDRVTDGMTYLRLQMEAFGGSNSGEWYIDAIGYSWDANYEIGDNKEVDWHTYNKEQITGIIQEPTIAPRLDAYWIGGITVRDFEGALFSSWYDRDFNKILIEDDSANVLFRGFLIKKTFKKDELSLSFAGIGIMLDWQPFGADGYIDYILAEGLVKAPISADSVLQVKDSEGADFTWANDYWIKEGRDVGILIMEGAAVSTRDWDSSAITQTTGSVVSGNNASTLTFQDSDSYRARDELYPNLDNVITLAINGTAVDDTDYLKSIEIQYNFRMWLKAQYLEYSHGTVHLQIKREIHPYFFKWVTIAKTDLEESIVGGTQTGQWITGIPTDDGGNGNEFTIRGTDAELQYYFHKTGATYTSLAGLRFIVTGTNVGGGWVDVDIDFIKVVVGYKSDDISPIMEQITDSAATSLTCSSVSAWDETGVAVDDNFKIGQNTRVILKDIASQSGLNVFFESPTRFHTLIPDQNGAINDWTLSGYARVITIDASAIAAELVDQGEYEEFGFPNDIDFPGSDVVTEIKVYTYGKKSGVDSNFRVRVYYNGSWEDEQASTCGAAYAWESHTFPITGGTVVPDDLKVSYRAFTVSDPSNVWIDACYVVVKVEYANVFERYTAQKYIGAYCMEPLRAICNLEGAHWYEDYTNDRIVVLKKEAFLDSGVDLTEADYGHDWSFEDECNQVRSFYVFGNAENEIFAKAIDESVDGYLSRQIVDETISTTADAQEIADTQLALLNSKRPSIKLSLNGVNANLQLGKTVDVTLVRPTVAKTNYIIRKIERSKFGGGIKTVIYCGLGESPVGERIGKIIRDNAFRSHKALRDRLMSP